jgi:hypothetical protein
MIKKTPSRSSMKQMGEEPRRSREERKVCFDSIEIREYGCALGRGNVCSDGCPVSLDWSTHRRFVYTVDRYEEKFESQRRVRGELFIAVPIRSQRLLATGYSIDQIVDGAIEAQVIRKQRAETYQKKQFSGGFGGVLEATGRKLRKAVGLQKNTESATAA